MSKPVIEVKHLSKVYNINHEQEAAAGTMTLRDNLKQLASKPIEIITGHKVKKEKFWALDDINFELNRGDTLGIIGRNGSGKSTMLKVLSRITDPTEGEIHMRGRVASLLEVGTGFHQELTGRENVYFNGAILGMTRKEINEKFDEIVAFSEVEKFLDTPVKFYSSGMYVRLAFAVAAHLDPDILIVDEVLAVGDAAFQKKCLGKMKDVAGQGRTVLFVSHNLQSIKSLCNKGLWLSKGKVMKAGDMEDVADSYAASAVESQTDLTDRRRTTPVSLEAKIISIDVASKGMSGPLVDSSQPMTIEYTIEAKQALEGVVLHSVINSEGIALSRLMSEYKDKLFNLKKGKNVITCIVEPTGLTGGFYSIDCSILFLGNEAAGHIDEVYDAQSFTVQDYKIEPGGHYLSQREAAIYLEHKWDQR